MAKDFTLTENIAERWFAEAVTVYAGQTAAFVTSEGDRFRNPVGHVLREGFLCIVQELLGGMDPVRLQQALEAVVRVRAIQSLTVGQAVGFVFPLRSILQDVETGLAAEAVATRIDALAMLAFEEYVRCRERLVEVRLNEAVRSAAVPAAISRARG